MKEMEYMNQREVHDFADVLDEGTCNGYEYVIVSFGTHPCAYVRLPEEHPWYERAYCDIPVECHGCLTYGGEGVPRAGKTEGNWIGWDYAHAMDRFGSLVGKTWTTAEILEEVESVIAQLESVGMTVEDRHWMECAQIAKYDDELAQAKKQNEKLRELLEMCVDDVNRAGRNCEMCNICAKQYDCTGLAKDCQYEWMHSQEAEEILKGE